MQKRKRKKDEKLLNEVRSKPCLVCNKIPAYPHHIRSRGAGGPDEPWNLIPLCQKHHSEWHQEGWFTFLHTHTKVVKVLDAYGWRIIELTDNSVRFWHPKLRGDNG